MKIEKLSKEEKHRTMHIIGKHFEKYWGLTLAFAILISIFGLVATIYWNFDENSSGDIEDIVYLISYIFLLLFGLSMLTILILNKCKVRIDSMSLAQHIHFFIFFIMIFMTVVCILDLKSGIPPIMYMVACLGIAGVFVLEPRFFCVTFFASILSIFIFTVVYRAQFYSNNYALENGVVSLAYIIIIEVIAIRHYRVTISEYNAQEKLEKLTYYDELTGLLNERSYVETTDELGRQYLEGTLEPFAVVMMDLNNLKNTNDTYGHHYGAHLIIKCGHELPKIFTTSKLFHVGGDEFIAIVQGEDFEHFDERMKQFDEALLYTEDEFEGHTLLLSVARGYAVYEPGLKYLDVFGRADDEMYKFKREMKKKYNITDR